MNAIRRLVRVLRTASQDVEGALGLSGAQLFVLETLAAGPAPSLGALAQRTLTDPSSVSVVVSRLVERKLVRRTVASDDARRAELALTRSGEALLRRAPETVQARAIATLEQLAASERRSLLHGIEALVRGIGVSTEPASMLFEEESRPVRKARAVTSGGRRHG
jgi:DNA-binding MarR family transcriptional regulator